ncbi:hypothetical protein [uncultured Aureimonas sp.]|uniref:hypothetical protein n=1 Tax=uncultured Aureimonas sp. TaxID=1604662 RepID=UPI0025DAAA71|nr:hypothetical protein [uncultured Aureimonas sp.]
MTATVAAALAWIYCELASYHAEGSSQRISDRDISAGTLLREIFSTKSQRLLRDADFGTPFRSTEDDDLDKLFYRWEGVACEFEDKHLQDRAARAVAAGRDFLELLSKHSGAYDRRKGTEDYHWRSVPTEDEIGRDEFEQHTRDNIAELRRAARDTLSKFEDWERSFRKLLPKGNAPIT